MPYSPQERQRRSDLAKRLHREGKFGGRQPAKRSAEVRRARADRVSELAQQMAMKHAAEIERALLDALKHGTRAQRIKASEALMKLALASERLDVTERKAEAEHMDRAQLLDTIAAKLSAPTPAAQLIRARLAEGAVDSTAVEIRS